MVSLSIIIVTQGREELLLKCLDSLRPDIPECQIVLLSNGKELTTEFIAKVQSLVPHFTYLNSEIPLSPGKACNMAIEATEGEWLYFLDEDAYVLPGYWQLVLPLLEEAKVDVLGGPVVPAKGMDALSLSLSLAMSSPFCSGMTFYRHKSFGNKLLVADEEKLTISNLWVRKKCLSEFHFSENYTQSEETILLQKLKKTGVGLYYHPKLKVARFRLTKLKEIWRPTFYAGFYRSKVMREKIEKGREAFWLPSVFVILHLVYFLDPMSFWYLARMYVSIILFVSLGLAVRAKRFWLFPLIGFLHYYVVLIYGVGFLVERTGIARKS